METAPGKPNEVEPSQISTRISGARLKWRVLLSYNARENRDDFQSATMVVEGQTSPGRFRDGINRSNHRNDIGNGRGGGRCCRCHHTMLLQK